MCQAFWKQSDCPLSLWSVLFGRERELDEVVEIREVTRSKDRDFPGGPVVKTLAANAGGAGSIPGQGTKAPHASRPKKRPHKIQGAKITWWLPSIKKDKTISAAEEMSLFRYKRK